jgi:hypothetical protein
VRVVWVLLIAAVASVLVTGCGGSRGSGTDTTESTTTEAAAAEVTSFDVGDLTCGAATTAPVTVTWATANATAVEIGVDEFSPQGFGPSGTRDVVVPCDDESHTITITPQSDAGTGQPESKDVSPN